MYVMTLDIADGQVQTIRSIINPDKLRHLPPLADIRNMLHQLKQRRSTQERSGSRVTPHLRQGTPRARL